MDYILITVSTIIAVALIAGLVFYLRKKSKLSGNDALVSLVSSSSDSGMLGADHIQNNIIAIPIELLPATTHIEEKRLFQITDQTVISRISELIPFTSQTGTRLIANNALNSLKGVELVKLDIPFSRLTKSKDVVGAARGYIHGGKGVAAQANLSKVDMSKVTKATTVANGVANVMNVGSLVVGQYYMSEISAKMETMTKSIDKISDFQNREFRSRILVLLPLVGEISKFDSEIMESDTLRNRKLHTLDDLKAEGAQLLQQVNLSVDEVIKKNQTPNYRDYQEKVDELMPLLEYQHILITVLEEISKLIYLLGKGENSREMSYYSFNTFLDQSNQIRSKLEDWHKNQVNSLGIDMDKNRRNKIGIESFFAAIPSLIDDKWRYKELEDGMSRKINAQKAGQQLMLTEPEAVYDNDVQIIIKDGKYFYLRD
ncbi:topoisomerase IV [Marasmitruncus massiliensis]|uniref:topoisomerase IV n=1 Tax=Marasmitruncus massiliensis TaxID=1944642 RepID=UPI000C7B7C0B|nr:topoisomerase IV [Marasmitruncus massiliensis]